MPTDRQTLEREFFQMLNRVVEPAVRKGVGSPRFVPGGLIVLETKAFRMMAGKRYRRPKSLPSLIGKMTDFLEPYTRAGWAFAVLAPVVIPR